MKVKIKDQIDSSITPKVSQEDFKSQIQNQDSILRNAIEIGDYEALSGVINSIEDRITQIKHEVDKQITENNLRFDKVILLVGATGAGKSTLLNYIAGKQLFYVNRTTRKFLAPLPDDSIAEVGEGKNSTTFVPNIRKIPEFDGTDDITFIDFAGDFDSLGVVGEIINSKIRANITNQCTREIKIILVCPQSILTSEAQYGKYLAEELNVLTKFIGNLNDFKNNIALIVSRGDRTEKLIKYIKKQITGFLEGNLRGYKDLLEHVMDNNLLTVFCKPEEANAEYSPRLCFDEQLDQIINTINSAQFKYISDKDFKVSASLNVKETMEKATEIIKQEIIQALKEEISEIIGKRFTKEPDKQSFINFLKQIEQHINLIAEEPKTIDQYIADFNKNPLLANINIENFSQLLKELNFVSKFVVGSDLEYQSSWKIKFDEALQSRPEVAIVVANLDSIPKIKQEIVDILRDEIDCIINQNQLLKAKPNELEEVISSLEQIQLIDEKLTIEEYVDKFNKNKFLPNIDINVFSQLSQKLKSAAEVNENPISTCQEFWGNKINIIEIFAGIKKEINEIKNGFWDLVEENERNGEITFKGYSVKISEVSKFLQTINFEVNYIRIFGLNEVVMDGKLFMPGCNVTILAPRWKIENKHSINLKGKNGMLDDLHTTSDASYISEKGANGIDGKPGLPGSSGGNFLGVGQEFINLKNLTVNVRGGKGGPGQNGGNGKKGEDKIYASTVFFDDATYFFLRCLDKAKGELSGALLMFQEAAKQNKIGEFTDLRNVFKKLGSVISGELADKLFKFNELGEPFVRENVNARQELERAIKCSKFDKLAKFGELMLLITVYELDKHEEIRILEKRKELELKALNSLHEKVDSFFNELSSLAESKGFKLEEFERLTEGEGFKIEEFESLTENRRLDLERLEGLMEDRRSEFDELESLIEGKSLELDELSSLMERRRLDLEECSRFEEQSKFDLEKIRKNKESMKYSHLSESLMMLHVLEETGRPSKPRIIKESMGLRELSHIVGEPWEIEKPAYMHRPSRTFGPKLLQLQNLIRSIKSREDITLELLSTFECIELVKTSAFGVLIEILENTRLTVKDMSTGGNSGLGGKGGLGGRSGVCRVVTPDNRVKKREDIDNLGKQGDPGKAGSAGEGGTLHLASLQGSSFRSLKNFRMSPITDLHIFQIAKAGPKGLVVFTKNDQNIEEPPPAIAQPNIRLSLLDYEMLLGKNSKGIQSKIAQSLLSSFCRECRNNFEIQESIVGFADELLRIEEYISLMQANDSSSKFLRFYYAIAKRIKSYALKETELSTQDINLLQHLYTSTLSRICQLNSVDEHKLVIDIKGFLEIVEHNINRLNQLNKLKMITHYKEQYASEIEKKIEEAKLFIGQLIQDIQKTESTIDNQIKEFLKEIECKIDQGGSNLTDLKNHQYELQKEMFKKVLFGVLNITIPSVGLIFGPPGTIIASLVTSTINSINQPSVDNLQEVLKNIEDLDKLLQTKLAVTAIDSKEVMILNKQEKVLEEVQLLLGDVKPYIEEVQKVSESFKQGQEELDIIKQAIKKAEEVIEKLENYKADIAESFGKRLHRIFEQIDNIHKNLKDQSIVAIDFNKLEVKRFFMIIKTEISKLTGEFTASQGFIDTIEKTMEVLEISMNIHGRIQTYKDQIIFANYIARVNSADVEKSIEFSELKPKIDELSIATQRNIILEEYYRAVSAVKQWAFPFADAFLADFDNLAEFLPNADSQEFIGAITQKLSLLNKKVKEYYTEVVPRGSAIIHTTFIDTSPFFVWSYEKGYSVEITKLLQGERVVLNADINKTPLRRSAVKFSQIGIEIKIKGANDLQNKLNAILNDYCVELHHSGNSYYRYSNKTYSINNKGIFNLLVSFKVDSDGRPTTRNETYNQIYEISKTGHNLMLSPYTYWAIKIEQSQNSNQTNLHDKLNSEIPDFQNIIQKLEIKLVGKGRYIDETKISLDDNKKLKVDSYYTKSTYSTLNFRDAEEENYEIESKNIYHQSNNALDKQNAFNQRENSKYWYQATDISLIQSQFKSNFFHISGPAENANKTLRWISFIRNQFKSDFLHIFGPIEDADSLNETLNKMTSFSFNSVCIYNLSNFHWVVLAILSNKSSKIALYKDSLGQTNETLSSKLMDLGITRFIYSKTKEQKDNSSVCGVLALKNMEIIARGIENMEGLIENFSTYKGFCTLDQAEGIRGKFAELYIHSKYNAIKQNKKIVKISELLKALNIEKGDTEGLELIESVFPRLSKTPDVEDTNADDEELAENSYIETITRTDGEGETISHIGETSNHQLDVAI